MNFLSRLQTLAIAAVLDIAMHARGVPVAAKALAARFDMPARHFETLLQALVKANILKGLRGPRGGYELARERRRISIADILIAIEPTDSEIALPLAQKLIVPALEPASSAFMARLETIHIAHLCQNNELVRSDADFTI